MIRPFAPPPTRADVEAALLLELSAYSDGERAVPNVWTVELADRDARKRSAELPQWSPVLAERLVDEHRRLGLPASGLVTVSFAAAPDLRRGRFRVAGSVASFDPVVVRREERVRGRPRVTIAAGGQVRHGSPAAAGIDREVTLPPGRFVVGRGDDADLRLHDPTVSPRHLRFEVSDDGVRVADLGSRNGTLVDGLPVIAADLVDGARIELGETTLVFHRDHVDDTGDPVSDSHSP
jgi:hypothetical protein